MSPDLDNKKKHVLANFFLELSNPIRIQILRILSEGVEYRNSAIAKMLNISAQECLRHLARLLHVNLVESIGRLYRIAPIGNLVLEGIFPPLKYLLKNQSFFTNHDLSILPPIFTRRLSEIADEETEIINGPSEIIALA